MKLDDITTLDMIQGKLKLMDKKMAQLNEYWLQETAGLTLTPDGKVVDREGKEHISLPFLKGDVSLALRRSPGSRPGSRPVSRQGSRPSSRVRSRSPHDERGYLSDVSRHSTGRKSEKKIDCMVIISY